MWKAWCGHTMSAGKRHGRDSDFGALSPQVAGPLTALAINDDENENENDDNIRPNVHSLSADSTPRQLCSTCSSLSVRQIIGKNRLGMTLRKTFEQADRDATSCRLCRLFVEALHKVNPQAQLRGSDRIRLLPHGRHRKKKHEELYALSVHLVHVGGSDASKSGTHSRSEINAGVLSMYTEEGNAASDTGNPAGPIAGREVCEASNFQTLKFWLNECITKHPDTCSSNGVYRKKSLVFLDDNHEHQLLPTRTIVVGDDPSSDTVYLQEHHNKERAPYIALSYCWGQEPNMIRTTANTIAQHKSSIRITSLPQTFQDAIVITRGLGVQHLWIDALCILQDSTEDWNHEASLMGALYAGAHLTIAALSSSSASGGLFFDRGLNKASVELPLGGKGDDQDSSVKVSLRSGPSTSAMPIMLEEEPHGQRAWTLQERLLSPRVLYCARLQYYWECRAMKRVEDGSKFPEGVMQVREPRKQSLVGSLANARPRAACDLWYEVVQTYSWRGLTYATDKLTALEGLVKTFQPYTKSSYIAGIWTDDLAQALAWRRSRRCPSLQRPDCARAPSWSWASCDGGLNHLNQRVFSNHQTPAWSSKLDNHVTGNLGILTRGRIAIEGLSADATCLQVSGPVIIRRTRAVRDLLRTKVTLHLDEGEDDGKDVESATGTLACLVLAQVTADSRRAHGLLLRELKTDVFERFGVVDIREHQNISGRVEKKTLYII